MIKVLFLNLFLDVYYIYLVIKVKILILIKKAIYFSYKLFFSRWLIII